MARTIKTSAPVALDVWVSPLMRKDPNSMVETVTVAVGKTFTPECVIAAANAWGKARGLSGNIADAKVIAHEDKPNVLHGRVKFTDGSRSITLVVKSPTPRKQSRESILAAKLREMGVDPDAL